MNNLEIEIPKKSNKLSWNHRFSEWILGTENGEPLFFDFANRNRKSL